MDLSIRHNLLSFEAAKSFSGYQLLSCREIYLFASESLQRADNTFCSFCGFRVFKFHEVLEPHKRHCSLPSAKAQYSSKVSKLAFCAVFPSQFSAVFSQSFSEVCDSYNLHDGFFNVEQQLLRAFRSCLTFPYEHVSSLLALLRSRSLFWYFLSATRMKA
jgi:hypothetical protein